MFRKYNKRTREEISSLSDEELKEEIIGNTNYLDTIDEVESKFGLSEDEKTFEADLTQEYGDLLGEAYNRSLKRRKNRRR